MKSREQKRIERKLRKDEPYMPSMLWIMCGVLFPPLGVYQLCRILGAERRAVKETRETARLIREDTARRIMEQNQASS